jgi:hypothetical protein
MTTEEAILQELKTISSALLANQTDYADSEEAARIISLKNTRDLKRLNEMQILPRYPRGKGGKGYVYKKKDCHRVAAMLDENKISL